MIFNQMALNSYQHDPKLQQPLMPEPERDAKLALLLVSLGNTSPAQEELCGRYPRLDAPRTLKTGALAAPRGVEIKVYLE